MTDNSTRGSFEVTVGTRGLSVIEPLSRNFEALWLAASKTLTHEGVEEDNRRHEEAKKKRRGGPASQIAVGQPRTSAANEGEANVVASRNNRLD